MDLTEYQKITPTTAIYPDANTGSIGAIMYCALEVVDEAGEVAGKIKKMYRDGKYDVEDIKKEMGDVFYPLSQLANELSVHAGAEITLEDIVAGNMSKLLDRKERGVLGGSGDNR